MSENIQETEVKEEEVATEATTEETTDSVEVNDIKIDEPLYWESLVTERTNLVNNIIQQQAIVLELARRYEKELAEDEDTAKALNGLILSIEDLAKNVAEITEKHRVDGKFREGKIDNDDDILEYLNYASTYVAIGENLANLLATAYIDVISRLTTDTILKANLEKEIAEAAEETKEDTDARESK